MKFAIIAVHVVSAAILAVQFYGGPPMGESELHPWDVVTAASSLVVLLLCPIAYVCLWKKEKLWSRFLTATSGSLLAVSGLLTAITLVIWFQWPYGFYESLWSACVHVFGKTA